MKVSCDVIKLHDVFRDYSQLPTATRGWNYVKYTTVTQYIYVHFTQSELKVYCNLIQLSTFCRLCATSVNILSSSSLYGRYMFRPNCPSSGVQAVVMKESAADCNVVLLFLCSCCGEGICCSL
jgi:hypothetical protein